MFIPSTKIFSLFLIIFSVITFSNTFKNEFLWDDGAFFVSNILTANLKNIPKLFVTNTTSGGGITSNYYRPITSVSFTIDRAIWGLNPFGFHLTNLLLHTATALLVFYLLIRFGMSNLAAFWITVIFIVHPVQVEAVTYLSSRGDILYSLSLLIALHLFWSSLAKKSLPKIFLCLLLYPLAILSKEGALAAPPLFLGLALFKQRLLKETFKKFYQRKRAEFILVWTLVLEGIIYIILRLSVLNFSNTLNYSGVSDLYSHSLLIRLYTFLKVVWLDLGLIVYPYPLYLDRTTDIVQNLFSPYVMFGLLLLISLIYLGIKENSKLKSNWILLGLLWTAIHLALVSGIVPNTALIRENWLYMPIVGLGLMVYGVWKVVTSKFKRLDKLNFNLIGLLLTLTLMIVTIQQNTVWHDSITYFEHNLKYYPTPRVRLNLAHEYLVKGDLAKAKYHYLLVTKESDIYPQAYDNLGIIAEKEGDLKGAEKNYIDALIMDNEYLFTYPKLIDLYAKQSRFEDGLPLIKRLSLIFPDDILIKGVYAQFLFGLDKKTEAEEVLANASHLAKTDQEKNYIQEVLSHPQDSPKRLQK